MHPTVQRAALWREVRLLNGFAAGGSDVRRPAIEAFTLLGAVAAETDRIAIGTLVARATLRPPATLAHHFDTVQRVSGGRLIAGIGAGDRDSRVENETFGLDFGTIEDRLAALDTARAAAMGRGYPVWVGGTLTSVRTIAARADGWNRWGGTPAQFARGVEHIRWRATEAPTAARCVPSWAGLVVLGEDEAAAKRKQSRLDPAPDVIVGGPERVAERLRDYVAAGAEWIIAGPVDSSDPDNAAILGERIAPLLA